MQEYFSVISAVISVFVAVFIPLQIMKFQRYTNLLTFYMTFDVAHALQSVIDFYYDTCNCDVEKISTNYEIRCKEDFANLKEGEGSNKEDVLHYQRRLLNSFFLELEKCRESSFFLRRIIQKDWTSSEAWVAKILIYMNKTVDENPSMYKKISCIKYDKMPNTKGLSKYLEKFYNSMKTTSRNMKI